MTAQTFLYSTPNSGLTAPGHQGALTADALLQIERTCADEPYFGESVRPDEHYDDINC
jgi:hypothetical protein